MIAVAGGLGAALAWALANLCATRASRRVGAGPVLAWVALVGLVATAALISWQRPLPTAGQTAWLAVAGAGNAAGLLCLYEGLRRGRVGIVIPIAATEGAVAAVIAVVLGQPLSALGVLALAVIAVGVVLVARPAEPGRPGEPAGAPSGVGAGAAAGFGGGAALLFGVSIYAAGHVARLPVGWIVAPSRVCGTLFVALPLLVRGRLRIERPAVPYVIAAGLGEVLGFVAFTLGARHNVAVAAVVASLFAAFAALGAWALFSERLGPTALAGLGTVVAGVGLLSAVHP